ncbi:hypothetical protein IWQ55_005024, partial [Labrenzia sp. EL_208]|nr:hypothetical protein [Labrenzia sp. EL_132]MBG6231792.1 hypothetical protein [Labrenzia sp. EL_208]
RTSGENLFVVLLIVLHPTQELEPPANPERLTSGFIAPFTRGVWPDSAYEQKAGYFAVIDALSNLQFAACGEIEEMTICA